MCLFWKHESQLKNTEVKVYSQVHSQPHWEEHQREWGNQQTSNTKGNSEALFNMALNCVTQYLAAVSVYMNAIKIIFYFKTHMKHYLLLFLF